VRRLKACENERADSQPKARPISSMVRLVCRKALAARLIRQRATAAGSGVSLEKRGFRWYPPGKPDVFG